MAVMDLPQHLVLAKALASPRSWPATARDLRLLQTHISSVVLGDGHAYKLKKPLDLGFLDFSSLEKRHFACEEELRLNRRLAPDIYQAVVPITGSPEQPIIGGEGAVIEWAVQMRRFDPRAVLAECPQRLNIGLMDRLAEQIADFHQAADVAPDAFGTLDEVAGPMRDNILQIRARRSAERAQLDELGDWIEQQLSDCEGLIEQRRRDGRVRECHGDLHLNNIVLIDAEPVIFDGIEFNPSLRYIDVFADLAFLTMDLVRIGREGLARHVLDRYLQLTGDYAGLPLLRLYEVYRAMVRVKVAAIHASERNLSPDQREQIVAELRRYLRVANRLTKPQPRGLIITHGVSGSGKSYVSDELLSAVPAIRIRSDVERKRLAGMQLTERATDALDETLYSPTMTARTYDRLAELAEQITAAGFPVIVDATFLEAARRQQFSALAERLGVPFSIIDCDAPSAELERRVRQRSMEGRDASDAGLAVLAQQLSQGEPLSVTEHAQAVFVTPEQPLDTDAVMERLRA